MPQVVIQFETATLAAIDRIAPAAKRKRAELIRKAGKDAIFKHEQDRIRRAYKLWPDSAHNADRWDLPEEWIE